MEKFKQWFKGIINAILGDIDKSNLSSANNSIV